LGKIKGNKRVEFTEKTTCAERVVEKVVGDVTGVG
jgi:hypothetical protein